MRPSSLTHSKAFGGTRWGLILVVVSLLVAMPLIWPAFPPLMDLPGHMASYAISAEINDPSLSKYYEFEWRLVGNLGFDGLVHVAAPMFGVELATKLLTICVVISNALGLILLSRTIHRRFEPTAILSLPLIYSYSFSLGFVNYCLSVSLLTWGLWLWIKLTCDGWFKTRAAAFLVFSVIVWIVHAIGWIILGAACGAWLLSYNIEHAPIKAVAIVRTFLACLPLCLPAAVQILFAEGQSELAVGGMFDVRLLAQWTIMLVRDQWLVWDILSAAIIFGIIGLALVGAGGLTMDRHLRWSALAIMVLFLVGPRSLNYGSDFVNTRLLAVACMLALVSVGSGQVAKAYRNALVVFAFVFFAGRMVGHTVSYYVYDKAFRHQLEALEAIPQGARVAAFAGVPCTNSFRNWSSPRLKYLSGMAVVRRHAFVNSLWAIPGLHLLRVTYPDAGEFQADTSGMVYLEDCPGRWLKTLDHSIRELPAKAFDRVWLLNVPVDSHPDDPRLRALWRGHNAVVYEVVRGR